MSRFDELRARHERRSRQVGMPVESPRADSGVAPSAAVPPPHGPGRGLHLLILAGFLLAGAFLGWRYWPGNADAGLARAAETYKHAVGLLVIEPKGSTDGSVHPLATAWAVGSNRFASCAHVVEKVLAALGEGGRVYVAINGLQDRRLYVRRAAVHGRYGTVAESGTNDVGFAYDVGLIDVDGAAACWFPVADGGEIARLRPGYRVASLGYPMERLVRGGVDPKSPVAVMQSGIITAVSDFSLAEAGVDANLLIRHNLGSAGGSSGSPLFNPRGEVVGIVNAGNMIMQMTGLDAGGKPVLARAPSAAMVNFAQRIDILEGVAWSSGRDRSSRVAAVDTTDSPLVSDTGALVSMAVGGTNVTYAAPPVDAVPLLDAAAGNREMVKETYTNGVRRLVEIIGPAGDVVRVNSFHDNGRLHVGSPRSAGRRHGVELSYSRAGRLARRTPYESGFRHGSEEVYDIATGHIYCRGIYARGALTEPETFFDGAGALMQGTLHLFYVNFEGTGATTNRFETCPVVDGRRHGRSTSWFESGAVQAVFPYKDGRLDGPCVSYHPSGREFFRGSYLRDTLHGECVWFHDNGQVARRGTWQAGRPLGTHAWYRTDGGLLKSEDHGAVTAVQ